MRKQPFASPGEALEHSQKEVDPLVKLGADFIEHYGIKGMRWGVRKAEETGGQGKVGIDPVTATYIAIFLGLTAISIRDMRRLKKDSGEQFEKANKNTAWKKKEGLSKSAPPMDVDSLFDSVVKPTNPGYPLKSGTKMNCRRCTFAYEMRRRGYDVKATPSWYATGQDDEGVRTATMSKQAKFDSIWGQKQISTPDTIRNSNATKRSELIFQEIAKNPDGARGELGVGWRFGGGHSMAWEIVQGKPVIFDTQTRTAYRKPNDFKKFAEVLDDAALTRTDNVKLDEQYLRRWMVNHD